jgi:cytochrome c553
MTNAQKWIGAFLGLFLLLFLIGRMTKKEEPVMPQAKGEVQNGTNQAAGESDGPSLLKSNGCVSCHGANLQGTNIAPELANLKEHWTHDGLINYLRNPESYGGDKRFDAYRQKYKNVMMPSFNNLDVKDLGKMAEYLLTR